MWIDYFDRKKADVCTAGRYYIDYHCSMKDVADNMCISESTARRYLNVYLKHIDYEMWQTVQRIKRENVERNKTHRDISGRFAK